METQHCFKLSFFSVYVIAFMGILVFTNCQKDDLKELVPEELNAPGTQSPLALEKAILEFIFQVPNTALGDEHILQLYTELTGHLSEEDRSRLIDMCENALSQKATDIPVNLISTRSVESILTTGIPNDLFGICVATVGNKVYVGARSLQKVYEYANTGGNYSLINEITPDPATLNFGSTVSVSGSWMAVSASLTASQGGGKVFMFKKQGSEWVQKAILTGPEGNNNFGALRGVGLQGNTLMVHSLMPGIPQTLTSTISVFTLSGNEWSLQQELSQPGISHNALRLDESEDRIATASGLGNMFGIPRSLIYVRDGSNWTLEAEVIIDLPGVGAALEVAINGNTVVLLPVFPGNLHLLITHNGGDWELSQELLIPAGQPLRRCIAQIEGQKIIIGAPSSTNAISDQVHVFENFVASWDLTETMTMSDLGINASIASMALEGNTIVAGCPGSTGFAGKVYVFD